MKKLMISALAATIVTSLATPALAEGGDPAKGAARKLKQMDTDANGSVSLEEFTTFRKAWIEKAGKDAKMAEPKAIKRAFDKVDADASGSITAQEFQAHAEAQKAAGSE